MIKKIFNNKLLLDSSPANSIASAAFIIMLFGLASRILGLLRDRFLASTFGAGDALDVYYAAFRIPDLIYNFLILGALSAAFIPIFSGLLSEKKEKQAWELANGILNIFIVLIIVISLIFCALTPWIMRFITPGFNPEKMEQVIVFTRIMFLSPIFLGISGIFGAILTSLKRFLMYSLAPIFYNIGIIIGVLIFVKFMGPIGLAWGVVLGTFLHMLVQCPAVFHLGFKNNFSLRKYFFNKDIRSVLKLMIPRMMGIAVNQFNLFIITIFASLLASGSLAVFSFAQNLQSVPLGIFGVSFAIAVFPTLSRLTKKENEKEFVGTFSETFRNILFFVIPLSIMILLLRAQIVRVVLGAGEFDWEDTILTYECLGFFSLSLFAQSLIPLLARSFYALKNTKIPFYAALISEVINILAVIFLIGKLKIIGLAIAFSLSSIFQMLLLLFLLHSRFGGLDDRNILRSIGKIVAASLASGVGIQLMKYCVAMFIDMDTFLGIFSQLVISAGIGTIVFITACHIFKIEEYHHFRKSITRKIFRQKGIISEDTGEVAGI